MSKRKKRNQAERLDFIYSKEKNKGGNMKRLLEIFETRLLEILETLIEINKALKEINTNVKHLDSLVLNQEYQKKKTR